MSGLMGRCAANIVGVKAVRFFEKKRGDRPSCFLRPVGALVIGFATVPRLAHGYILSPLRGCLQNATTGAKARNSCTSDAALEGRLFHGSVGRGDVCERRLIVRSRSWPRTGASFALPVAGCGRGWLIREQKGRGPGPEWCIGWGTWRGRRRGRLIAGQKKNRGAGPE